jgi:hypothetical protein
MCGRDRICQNPGSYAKQWLRATKSRRKAYYKRDGVGTANASVKWSYTLAEAAQNWTDFLIAQDDCQGVEDPSCYNGQEGFFRYCKLMHEGKGVGNPNPYGAYRHKLRISLMLGLYLSSSYP